MNKFIQLVIGAMFTGCAVTDFYTGRNGEATAELIIGLCILIDLIFKWGMGFHYKED